MVSSQEFSQEFIRARNLLRQAQEQLKKPIPKLRIEKIPLGGRDKQSGILERRTSED